METSFRKRFLTNTDETGRFIVKSVATGRVYYVEPIDNTPHHRIWGDVDPADKTLHGEYGKKYKGAVTEEESMITLENGFDKVHELGIGESPFSRIDEIDKEWELKNKMENTKNEQQCASDFKGCQNCKFHNVEKISCSHKYWNTCIVRDDDGYVIEYLYHLKK